MSACHDQLISELAAYANERTVAIFAHQFDVPAQHGTGTLLRIADDHFFLVSAAHVLRDSLAAKVPLSITAGDDNLIPLDHLGVVYSDEVQDAAAGDDPFDIAIWRLSEKTVSRLTIKKFIDQSDLLFQPNLEQGLFFVFGYPTELSAPISTDSLTIGQAAVCLLASPYAGSNSNLTNYRQQSHVLVGFDSAHATNSENNPHPFPRKLDGISGCSIWKVNEEVYGQLWKPGHARVIAVQTVYYSRSGAIRGTRWEGVLRVIVNQWPALRSCLHVYTPRNMAAI